MTEERIVSPDEWENDASSDKTLRPQYLTQYIGQEKVKRELLIYIEAAKRGQE
mgnify:CR=1 FL=1